MLSMLAVALTFAAAPATPTGVVKAANDEVQVMLKSDAASVEALSQKADLYIDFVELAKRAYGAEWAKLNKKQQDEFARTMRELLRASYAQKALTDGKNGAEVAYLSESTKAGESLVKTTLQVGKDKFPVDYKLYKVDAKTGWKIYDVVTDGVSLVTTYNDQFRKLLGKGGFDGLLTTLKAKRDQLVAQAQPAAADAGN